METSGYILLHRCILEKPIWTGATLEQKAILITILLMANHKEKSWVWNGKKFKAKPGQFVSSLDKIADLAGVTIQNVRTAINKFQRLEFLTNQSTKTGRLITIVNWRVYQTEAIAANKATNRTTNKAANKELTKDQQRANKQLTTTNNDNNDNNDKDIYNVPFAEIILALNETAGTRYRITEQHKKYISARWEDGYRFDDFKTVIRKKSDEWLGTEQAKYLRPETLFGTKFDSYLNQIVHSNKSQTQQGLDDLERICAEYDRANAQADNRHGYGQLPVTTECGCKEDCSPLDGDL